VGFGDEFPLLGRDNADRPDLPRFPNTLPAGWAVFVDGDAHMLLDFSAASSAVIDTEFRFGGGVMGRGIPWFTSRFDRLSHLCWKVKYFHESTHLGDEYERAALANPQFRRVNVSFEALETFLAVDRFSQSGLFRYLRAYAGYRRLFHGPYDLEPASRVTSAGARDEGQLGADIRRELLGPLPHLCNRFLGRLLCPNAGIFGVDLSLRRQFDFDGSNASPRWLTVHASSDSSGVRSSRTRSYSASIWMAISA